MSILVLHPVRDMGEHHGTLGRYLTTVTLHLVFAYISDFLAVEKHPVRGVSCILALPYPVFHDINPDPCVIPVSFQDPLVILVSGYLHAALDGLDNPAIGSRVHRSRHLVAEINALHEGGIFATLVMERSLSRFVDFRLRERSRTVHGFQSAPAFESPSGI